MNQAQDFLPRSSSPGEPSQGHMCEVKGEAQVHLGDDRVTQAIVHRTDLFPRPLLGLALRGHVHVQWIAFAPPLPPPNLGPRNIQLMVGNSGHTVTWCPLARGPISHQMLLFNSEYFSAADNMLSFQDFTSYFGVCQRCHMVPLSTADTICTMVAS